MLWIWVKLFLRFSTEILLCCKNLFIEYWTHYATALWHKYIHRYMIARVVLLLIVLYVNGEGGAFDCMKMYWSSNKQIVFRSVRLQLPDNYCDFDLVQVLSLFGMFYFCNILVLITSFWFRKIPIFRQNKFKIRKRKVESETLTDPFSLFSPSKQV